jgi:hypothetical protein
MQRRLARLIRGVLQVRARLRVDQIRRGDISERLSCAHEFGGELPRSAAVEVERSEAQVIVIQWKGEHRCQPGGQRSRRESRKSILEV